MFQQSNVYFLFGLSDGGFYFSCLNHKTDFVFAPSAPTWPYFLPTFSTVALSLPSCVQAWVSEGLHATLDPSQEETIRTQNLKMTSVVFLPPHPNRRLEAVVGLSHPHRRHVWTGVPYRGEPTAQAEEGRDNETLWGQQSILSPLLVMLLSLCVKFPTKNTNFELGIWH